jgi:acetyl esterase/lipase
LDPTEPTLDLYIPPSDKATGAGVLILPGGGYQMLTVPGEGAEPARFFLSHNVAAFVLRYRHGPRYHLSDDAPGRPACAAAHSSARSGVSRRAGDGRRSGRIGWRTPGRHDGDAV